MSFDYNKETNVTEIDAKGNIVLSRNPALLNFTANAVKERRNSVEFKNLHVHGIGLTLVDKLKTSWFVMKFIWKRRNPFEESRK